MTLRLDYGVYNYDRVTAARTRGNCMKIERGQQREKKTRREREGDRSSTWLLINNVSSCQRSRSLTSACWLTRLFETQPHGDHRGDGRNVNRGGYAMFPQRDKRAGADRQLLIPSRVVVEHLVTFVIKSSGAAARNALYGVVVVIVLPLRSPPGASVSRTPARLFRSRDGHLPPLAFFFRHAEGPRGR